MPGSTCDALTKRLQELDDTLGRITTLRDSVSDKKDAVCGGTPPPIEPQPGSITQTDSYGNQFTFNYDIAGHVQTLVVVPGTGNPTPGDGLLVSFYVDGALKGSVSMRIVNVPYTFTISDLWLTVDNGVNPVVLNFTYETRTF
jgi:hypothetical protein